jgi:hypothetical protein
MSRWFTDADASQHELVIWKPPDARLPHARIGDKTIGVLTFVALKVRAPFDFIGAHATL